jgi:hypothetical protein
VDDGERSLQITMVEDGPAPPALWSLSFGEKRSHTTAL